MFGFLLYNARRSVVDSRDRPSVNFSPLRQKLLKTLQNEASYPLITMNVLIYASNHLKLLDFENLCQT